jgi:acyl carrier protein
MAPKVRGAWLLDQLTRDQTLDFFVLFSSTASVLGSVGQANYASANAYLDALADKRRLEGLPALSINWGPWEDVGMAARLSARERARIALRGFPFIPPPEGLRVLDRLLAVGRGNIIAMPARWRDLLQGVEVGAEPALLKVIATEVARRQPTARRDSQISGLRARLDAAAPGQRPGIMQAFLRAELARVLGAEHAEELNADASFGALGVDSLMALELRNALSSALARPVPSSAVFEYPSIDALATHLLSEPAQAVATVRRAADHDTTDAVKLLSNLDQLSDEAVDALLSQLATEKELPG